MISEVIYGEAQAGRWMADVSSDYTKLKGFHFSGTEVHDGKITSYTLRTVANVEIENQETMPDAVGGIAGAAMGGLLLGPVGAIGGMLAGGRASETVAKVTLCDGSLFVVRMASETVEKLQAAAYENKKLGYRADQIVRFSKAEYKRKHHSPEAIAQRLRDDADAERTGKRFMLGCFGVVVIIVALFYLYYLVTK